MNINKFLTFSFDDGVQQDIRMIELLNKYGLKATFNLNSGLLGERRILSGDWGTVEHHKVKPDDVRVIYEGHEVAAHTISHRLLPEIKEEAEIIHEVENDRIRLSELCGYEVTGMAYPCGGKNYNDRVSKVISGKTGIHYARTIESSYTFKLPENLYQWKPSVYSFREMDRMFELGEKFLQLKTEFPKVFYIWGHAYEFDIRNNWNCLEKFFEMISGHEDIYYCTNREIIELLSK